MTSNNLVPAGGVPLGELSCCWASAHVLWHHSGSVQMQKWGLNMALTPVDRSHMSAKATFVAKHTAHHCIQPLIAATMAGPAAKHAAAEKGQAALDKMQQLLAHQSSWGCCYSWLVLFASLAPPPPPHAPVSIFHGRCIDGCPHFQSRSSIHKRHSEHNTECSWCLPKQLRVLPLRGWGASPARRHRVTATSHGLSNKIFSSV